MQWSQRTTQTSGILLLFMSVTMQLDDIASKGVATQSSSWYSYNAANGIYGNPGSAFFSGQACSCTNQQTNPWWRVDLLDVYSVTAVAVTNRRDCCPRRLDGAEIHIGNSLENNGINNSLCATISSIPAGVTETFQCNEMKGRYVVVFNPGQEKWLTLCGVQVYGSLVKTQQVVRVRLTPKDQNMDLTDPEVQESILQQIYTELQEKGEPGDLKLRWKEQPEGTIFHKEEKGNNCMSP